MISRQNALHPPRYLISQLLNSRRMVVLPRSDTEETLSEEVRATIKHDDRYQPLRLENGQLDEASQQAFQDAETILAIGGDGTLNLACRLMQTHQKQSVPLLLLPAGTANDFARHLLENRGINFDNFIAGDVAQRTLVDLVSVRRDHSSTSDCFVNMLTGGSSARQADELDEDTKANWGKLTYLVQFYRTVTNLEPFTVQVTEAGHQRTFTDVVNFFVANGPTCGGGYRVANGASCTDGLADLIIVRQGTAGQLAALAADFLRLRHLDNPLVDTLSASQFELVLEQSCGITLDGETTTAQHLEVEVLRGALDLWLIPQR